MSTWAAAMWGTIGAALIELIDLYKLVRRADGTYVLPSEPRSFWRAYYVAACIRLAMGAASASVCVLIDAVSGPLGAIGVGVGATTFLERLLRSHAGYAENVSIEARVSEAARTHIRDLIREDARLPEGEHTGEGPMEGHQ